MLRNELGEMMRSERRRLGLSLRELAGRAGISATYLGEVERGLKEPSFEVLESLAGALEKSPAEILRGLADRIDPPQTPRPLGFRLGAAAAPVRTPSVQAITSRLCQEDMYTLARFGEFLLLAHGSEPASSP